MQLKHYAENWGSIVENKTIFIFDLDQTTINSEHRVGHGSLTSWVRNSTRENIMNDPFYRKQYTANLRTIINESLDTSIIRSSINTLQSLAHNAVDSDQNRQYNTTEYYSNVRHL